MTDLTDRGYKKVGAINGEPIWQDEKGDRWIEYTRTMRSAVQNFHAAPFVDAGGGAAVANIKDLHISKADVVVDDADYQSVREDAEGDFAAAAGQDDPFDKPLKSEQKPPISCEACE